MAERQYNIMVPIEVTVDPDEGWVRVIVEIAGLASELQYDYDYTYPSTETKRAEELINELMLTSPDHHQIRHIMTTNQTEEKE